MKHTEKYFTKFHDSDASRLLRPSAIFTYMQETANMQFFRSNMSLEKIRDEKGLAFILSRMAVDIYEPIRPFEEIDVSTWTCPSKGYVFNRCFEICSHGRVVAQSESVWALLRLDTHKIERIESTDFMGLFENEPMIETDMPIRFRITEPEKLEKVAERKILYSDIDYNMHMNNTHYPDMLCDYIPDMEKRTVTGMSFAWMQEAHYGATVDIYRIEAEDEPGTFFFRICGENDTVPKIEAKIKTIYTDDIRE